MGAQGGVLLGFGSTFEDGSLPEQLAGRARATQIVVEDALRKEETATLEYREMKLRDLPEPSFHQRLPKTPRVMIYRDGHFR